jgi:short-subunit dehydrogenase
MELKGMTALVTGASSGIGEAISRRLAAEGVNLVLVARDEGRLQALAGALAVECGVQTTAIKADLSRPKQREALVAQTAAKGIDVGILVNSAGFGTYGPFESLDPEREQNEVAVNVAAVVDLAHAFLPRMLERRRGAILNIASTAAFQPGPYMAVYAATKAFVLSFSEALWAECRGRGVHAVALCPGAVDTGFISALGDEGARETAVFSRLLRADDVALQALRALRGNAPTRVVGGRNWLMVQSARFASRAFVARTGERMLRPRRLALLPPGRQNA